MPDLIPSSVSSRQQVVDEFVTNKRGSLKFPLLFIVDASDALPVVAPSLTEGDLPLVFSYKGKLAQLKEISRTPENLQILTSIFQLVLYTSHDTKHFISSLFDFTQIENFEMLHWSEL